MRKRLLFDATKLYNFNGNLTGISRTIANFIKHFPVEQENLMFGIMVFSLEENTYKVLTFQEYLNQIRRPLQELGLELPNNESIYCSLEISHEDSVLLLGEQWLYPTCMEYLKAKKADLNFKVVFFGHDIVPFFEPQFYWDGFAKVFKSTILECVDLADLLIVNSKCTLSDFQSLAVRSSKILPSSTILRLGDSFDFDHSCIKPMSFGVPYCVSVGTIQPRKNHRLLYNAWKLLKRRLGENTPLLVFVGSMGWNVENLIWEIENDQDIGSLIRITNPSSDADLVALYKGATLNLYPSFYEGWGLPVAEASALGLPSLASNTSSLPEIAGELVEYFDPYDALGLASRIHDIVSDISLQRSIRESLLLRFNSTKWEDSARGFYEIIGS